MKMQVICTVFRRAIHLRRLIDCFVLQTDNRWELHVIHDGEPTPEVMATMALYDDPRITFTSTPEVNGHYGHPNRNLMLGKLASKTDEFVLITNDDNQYVAKFVEFFLKACNPEVGFVFCDTVHSYEQYNLLVTQVKENHIDMGSFIVKLDVARRVGFNYTHLSADGKYAEECAAYCKLRRLRIVHIPKPNFIHN
jgi:hypothetical protein